ncbi:hypothetical protein AcV5_008363 [Taiwanofungus camphoratus]|nr:hypothetical protein AcV5_008363 [Antrodia cinnamomea]
MEIIDEFSLENPVNVTSSRLARLIPLTSTDPHYAEIERIFLKGWKHAKKAQPPVQSIFKIVSPSSNLRPYLKYKESITSPEGEHFLFHGTNRACLLGETSQNVVLCNLPECYLCAILRESFDVERCGYKHKFSRFGSGISACSSKADDYVQNGSKDAVWRVLLLNRVVIGRAKRLRRNVVNLTRPPSGYDSVIGEPGVDLNYEETVVYRNDAIRPTHLVVYGAVPAQGARKPLETILRKLFTTPLAS